MEQNVKKTLRAIPETPTLRAMSWLMLGLVWWWIMQLISVSSGALALAISGDITVTVPRTINRWGRLFLTLAQPSYPNVACFCLQFWSHSSLCWCVNTSLSKSLPTACGFQMPCSSVWRAGKSTCQLFGDSADRKLNTLTSARGFCLLLWLLWRDGACVLQLWRCIQVLLGLFFRSFALTHQQTSLTTWFKASVLTEGKGRKSN